MLGEELKQLSELLRVSTTILGAKFKDENKYQKLLSESIDIERDLTDQRDRFNKPEFDIAVVGREKAGKSTLLNSLIGCDVLPTDRGRCTYTTIEIRSAEDASKQRYSIEYFTRKEFDEHLQQKEDAASKLQDTASRDRDLYNNEINEIKQHYNNIISHLNKEIVKESFENIEQVADKLKDAISNPQHARAVRKICIWTQILNSEEIGRPIILHDVPGYDSPITMHKQQTREIMSKVDGILFAKQFRSPDLVDTEVEILKISDSNQYIKTKDKTIVVLTNIDIDLNSREDYDTTLKSNLKEWNKHGIPSYRVVPISAIAELESRKALYDKARSLLNGFNIDTGLLKLKDSVKECVETCKNKVARERCDEIRNKIKEFCIKLAELVESDLSINENTDISSKKEETLIESSLNDWWSNEWKKIHHEFLCFFSEKIRPRKDFDGYTQPTANAIILKEAYDKFIEDNFRPMISNVDSFLHDSIKDDCYVYMKEFNIKIRDDLKEKIFIEVYKISDHIYKHIWNTIEEMINWIDNRMWNIKIINDQMTGSKDKISEEIKLKLSLNGMISRMAISAANLFIQFPRSKVERLQVMRQYQLEIPILNQFYEKDRCYKRGIIQFLANGELNERITLDKVFAECKPSKEESIKPYEVTVKTENENFVENKELAPSKPIKSSDKLKWSSKIGLLQGGKHHKSEKNLSEYLIDKNNSQASVQIPASSNFYLEKVSALDNDNINDYRINETIEINDAITNETSYENFQLLNLEFQEASTKQKVKDEIKADMDEFINCMKNSVFYGSGIQTFFNQELDRFRRKFINLSSYWTREVISYAKSEKSKNKIPDIPSLDDDIRKKKELVLALREMKDLMKQNLVLY